MIFFGSVRKELADIRQLLNKHLQLLEQVDNKIDQMKQQESKNMSQITDWAAQQQADLTNISTTLDGVVAGIVTLDTLITNFQNSPGTLSAPDQAALDAVQAASKDLVAKASAISVAPPSPRSCCQAIRPWPAALI